MPVIRGRDEDGGNGVVVQHHAQVLNRLGLGPLPGGDIDGQLVGAVPIRIAYDGSVMLFRFDSQRYTFVVSRRVESRSGAPRQGLGPSVAAPFGGVALSGLNQRTFP